MKIRDDVYCEKFTDHRGLHFEDYCNVFRKDDEYCFITAGSVWFDSVGNILNGEIVDMLNDLRVRFFPPAGQKKVFKGLKRKNEIK